MADKIPLAVLRKRLTDEFDGRVFSYPRFWQEAASGMLPGAALEYGRWMVNEASIPAIAAYFKLTPKAKAKRGSKVAA